MRYAEFVVPLVKAVQELSIENDQLKTKNNDLESRLAKLEAIMNVQQTSLSNNNQTRNITNALLEQNIPNPFNNTLLLITPCRSTTVLQKLCLQIKMEEH